MELLPAFDLRPGVGFLIQPGIRIGFRQIFNLSLDLLCLICMGCYLFCFYY